MDYEIPTLSDFARTLSSLANFGFGDAVTPQMIATMQQSIGVPTGNYVDFNAANPSVFNPLNSGASAPFNINLMDFPTADDIIRSASTGGSLLLTSGGELERALGTLSAGADPSLSVPWLQEMLQTTTGARSTTNWPGVATSGLQALISKYLADKYDTLARDLSDRADPFGSANVTGLRKQAQDEYSSQYSGGPLSWMETTYKPFAERNMDIELRKAAAVHGNPALNPGALAEATRVSTQKGYDAYLNSRGLVAAEAGAKASPADAAGLYGTAAGAGLNQTGNIGGALGSGISYATGGTGSQSNDNILNTMRGALSLYNSFA